MNSFGEHGNLRLSSFAAFKQNKSEQQGDMSEGSVFSGINDLEKDRHFFTATNSGSNAFVLCGTMRTGTDVAKVFGEASFEFLSPLDFALRWRTRYPDALTP